MKVVEISLDKLRPFERNPRAISSEAIKKVKESILNHGFNQPLVIDKKTMKICVGNTRYLAAKELELKKVPCYLKEFKSQGHFMAYNLADNKTNEFTSWEVSGLKDILSELDKNFSDLTIKTAFDDSEINALLDFEEDDEEKLSEPVVEGGRGLKERSGESGLNMVQFFYNDEDYHKVTGLMERIQTEEDGIDSASEAVMFALKNHFEK